MKAKRRQRQLIAPGMHWHAYALIERAVEEGITTGWRRAHKHTDTPSETHVCDSLHTAIMNALCEVLVFDGDSIEKSYVISGVGEKLD
jgi:hypothetical protein